MQNISRQPGVRTIVRAGIVAGACLALAAASYAAPIRVGIFKGVDTSGRWSLSTHTAANALASLLAYPDSANLGPFLVKPSAGFVASSFGVAEQASGTEPLVRSPTSEEKAVFIAALDSLDVLVFPSNSGLEQLFDQPGQRQKLEAFFKTRGVVSLGWSLDRTTDWPAWASLHGTRLNGWMIDGMATVRRDTAAAQDPDWRFLNRGLPDTARFRDEWISFTTNGAAIRAVPGLKVTMYLDETSFAGTANNRRMGDHPNSWYRELPEGGRFFYTGNGYRIQNFTGAATLDSTGDTTAPATNFFRRQLYNAILWAAGVDSNGVVSIRGSASNNVSKFSDVARIESNRTGFLVSLLQEGPHSVELLTLNGQRIEIRHGAGRADHTFRGLRTGAYVVNVDVGKQRNSRLVTVP